ncbi:uncharacterized protein LOC129581362 [Paramacrobiotus metropolitanus]|uniref:uncharacterized protein LOC129581362 n=1 Tax=Paramacrobiotus metropolitanus TaxID=2943436 RepID=UPI0024463C44|nr:uncharacterized protein LOC129581362 [Paramacrobiotus metropolitanus]
MSTSGAIIVIALSGVLLQVGAWPTKWYGQPLYKYDEPLEFAFACTASSPAITKKYERITKVFTANCSDPNITEIANDSSQSGDPANQNVTHHVRYTCHQNVTGVDYLLSGPMGCDFADAENGYCSSCTTMYNSIMCQYHLFSLSRLSKTCVPIFDKLTKLQLVKRTDDNESPWYTYTGPMSLSDHTRNSKEGGGPPYCDGGKPSMVLSPCCVQPVMVLVTGEGCRQKVICGTRPEKIVPFKINWDISMESWNGSHFEAWNRMMWYSHRFLNVAMNQLDTCMNATDRVSVDDQCSRCKADPFVKRLFEVGYTVVTDIPLHRPDSEYPVIQKYIALTEAGRNRN